MARELILDTGGLVSLLDRSQTRHRECVVVYESWTGPVVSTEAVLTEATHLLRRVPGGMAAVLEFFLRGGAVLVPTSRDTLERCRRLVDTYSDLPMDYADATLVALAEDLNATHVLTTDRRGFSVYRLASGAAFDIVP